MAAPHGSLWAFLAWDRLEYEATLDDERPRGKRRPRARVRPHDETRKSSEEGKQK